MHPTKFLTMEVCLERFIRSHLMGENSDKTDYALLTIMKFFQILR